ncbi:MAG TPA: hypothetical protein VG984_01425 [Candidatus Paceibacterota bacterium]|nr:hypothetical protein [Candidatus Paceibacterota bacterium]
MTVDAYLKEYIEGYLFKDIEGIQKGIPMPLPPGEFGTAAYPILMSCLAGMEMLGYLLMRDGKGFEIKPRVGETRFLNYWDNYFSKQNTVYTGLGEIFYVLLRHGLAHAFLSKHGIWVTRGTREDTKVNTRSRSISLDADVFFEEFKRSYFDLAKPVILTGSQAQLDDFLAKSQTQSDKEFEELDKRGIARDDLTYDMRARGASGPAPIVSDVLTSASGPRSPHDMVTIIQGSGIGMAQARPIFPTAPKSIDKKENKDSVDKDT